MIETNHQIVKNSSVKMNRIQSMEDKKEKDTIANSQLTNRQLSKMTKFRRVSHI